MKHKISGCQTVTIKILSPYFLSVKNIFYSANNINNKTESINIH